MTKDYKKDFLHLNMTTYDENYLQEYNGWKLVDSHENKKTGFLGLVYESQNDIVVVVKGTDIDKINDWRNDLALARNKTPNQLADALELIKKVERRNIFKKNINLTGYSLGGTITMLAGSLTGYKTTTYGAFGGKEILGKNAKYTDNIENYGYHEDPIFNANKDNMIGKTFLLSKKGESAKPQNTDPRKILTHIPPYDYDLDGAKEYKPVKHTTLEGKVFNGDFGAVNKMSLKEITELSKITAKKSAPIIEYYTSKAVDKFTDSIKNNLNEKTDDLASYVLNPAKRVKERLKQEWSERASKKSESKEKFEGTVLTGYVNNYSNSNKIYTQEEIDNMSVKQKKNLKNEIAYQEKTIGIPTKEMADKAVKSGGMVHVKEYIRADGIKVHSYYRARPGK